MKHKNLQKLAAAGFCVPKFIAVKREEDYDADFSNAKLFAVRSSFSSEDREDASFAGQFETFLNVSREEVREKIRMVLQCAGERKCQKL